MFDNCFQKLKNMFSNKKLFYIFFLLFFSLIKHKIWCFQITSFSYFQLFFESCFK